MYGLRNLAHIDSSSNLETKENRTLNRTDKSHDVISMVGASFKKESSIVQAQSAMNRTISRSNEPFEFMQSMPLEIIYNILDFMRLKEKLKLRSLSKKCRQLVDDYEFTWKRARLHFKVKDNASLSDVKLFVDFMDRVSTLVTHARLSCPIVLSQQAKAQLNDIADTTVSLTNTNPTTLSVWHSLLVHDINIRSLAVLNLFAARLMHSLTIESFLDTSMSKVRDNKFFSHQHATELVPFRQLRSFDIYCLINQSCIWDRVFSENPLLNRSHIVFSELRELHVHFYMDSAQNLLDCVDKLKYLELVEFEYCNPIDDLTHTTTSSTQIKKAEAHQEQSESSDNSDNDDLADDDSSGYGSSPCKKLKRSHHDNSNNEKNKQRRSVAISSRLRTIQLNNVSALLALAVLERLAVRSSLDSLSLFVKNFYYPKLDFDLPKQDEQFRRLFKCLRSFKSLRRLDTNVYHIYAANSSQNVMIAPEQTRLDASSALESLALVEDDVDMADNVDTKRRRFKIVDKSVSFFSFSNVFKLISNVSHDSKLTRLAIQLNLNCSSSNNEHNHEDYEGFFQALLLLLATECYDRLETLTIYLFCFSCSRKSLDTCMLRKRFTNDESMHLVDYMQRHLSQTYKLLATDKSLKQKCLDSHVQLVVNYL